MVGGLHATGRATFHPTLHPAPTLPWQYFQLLVGGDADPCDECDVAQAQGKTIAAIPITTRRLRSL